MRSFIRFKHLMSVLLPQPLGPISAVMSPAEIFIVTSRTATFAPYLTERSATSNTMSRTGRCPSAFSPTTSWPGIRIVKIGSSLITRVSWSIISSPLPATAGRYARPVHDTRQPRVRERYSLCTLLAARNEIASADRKDQHDREEAERGSPGDVVPRFYRG